MRVFVTGATGWVGSHVVEELRAGHELRGLARSEATAAALRGKGVEPVMGSLEDTAILTQAARGADAAIHLAFNHDFSAFAESAEQDRRAIEALGAGLEGTDRPLLVTSGVALVSPGSVAHETDFPPDDPQVPRLSERAVAAVRARGVRVRTIRLSPSVHGLGETHGFLPTLIALARESGVSAYVGEGANRWAAVHVTDAARLYRLALESEAEDAVFHAVAQEGVAVRDIAETIGRSLNLPVEPREAAHFGWFGALAGGDFPASSARTREALGWSPQGPDLMTDLTTPGYGDPA